MRLAACGLAIALAAPPERILDPGIVAVAWGEEESVAAAGHAEGGAAPEGIQTIAAILALPATDRAARPVVRVRGFVTRLNRVSCIIQDESGRGIFVEGVPEAALGPPDGYTPAPPANKAVKVEVTGRLDPGGFSPYLIVDSFDRVGEGPLPACRSFDHDRFFSGADDCTLVEVTGVVQAIRPFGSTSWRAMLETQGRSFIVDIKKTAVESDLSGLVDATVRVRGPTVSIFNTRGGFLEPWVTVNRVGGLEVLEPADSDPFDAPRVPLRQLAGFRTLPLGGRRFVTEGVVIHAESGRVVHLQDGDTGVEVLTTSTGPLAPGDRVEVAGFLDTGGVVARVKHAILRQAGDANVPEPIPIDPVEVLDRNAKAASAATMAVPGDLDGCLVQLRGTIIDRLTGPGSGLLLLRCGATDVTVQLWNPSRGERPPLALGSLIDVSGILRVQWRLNPVVWPPHVPEALTILARSPEDIRIVRGPSWWTPARLALLAASIAALLAGALAWVWLLRREVGRQRRLVEREARRRERSEARRRTELEGKLRASLAAAAIVHEIKLPLANILMGSRKAVDILAAADGSAETVQPVIESLADESRRVVSTIERMRSLLRSVETDHTPVDMANVVHNALLRCRQELGRIGVAVETAGLDPLEVSGDAVQLQGAVVNLLRNAIDAVADLPPDRRRVRVELRRELVPVEGDDPQADAAACCCLVVVGDSGPGLPREVVDRMPLHTTKPHGSGLGLFLVGAVAENHAGRLEVGRSSLGGAEVRIVLPSRG